MDHRDMENQGLSSERYRMAIILLALVHFFLQRNEEPSHHTDVSLTWMFHTHSVQEAFQVYY